MNGKGKRFKVPIFIFKTNVSSRVTDLPTLFIDIISIAFGNILKIEPDWEILNEMEVWVLWVQKWLFSIMCSTNYLYYQIRNYCINF